MKIRILSDRMMQENTYIYYDEKTLDAIVVDPALNIKEEKDFISQKKLNVKYIMLTHSHADHIGDVIELKDFTKAKVLANINEKELLNDANKNLSSQFFPRKIEFEADIYVNEGDQIEIGQNIISFINTPGHTKGGMCIQCGNDLFTGDTLFNGSIGRTDLYSGDYEQILNSLKKLSKLDDNIVIYPGHGPSSTIGEEKRNNEYMKLVLR
ncbi:MBL fold metallo-hydrolase [Peptostreptococcus faecalis]|uniref:MBL fold metallo-hydrolase n=1 Tax=Peptostreptococcus faecalis TaxID=2045015 RepID=UPI000C7BEF17|nr:MBL fold metallo-hydrolase [Peptostreptococcus faecalis]